ncbi:hypothetical protein Pelo_18316 [Pelomyxa schiedti]|nr:hypothetical protein Pelo_18316 [Pelomyxa schiedti]
MDYLTVIASPSSSSQGPHAATPSEQPISMADGATGQTPPMAPEPLKLDGDRGEARERMPQQHNEGTGEDSGNEANPELDGEEDEVVREEEPAAGAADMEEEEGEAAVSLSSPKMPLHRTKAFYPSPDEKDLLERWNIQQRL